MLNDQEVMELTALLVRDNKQIDRIEMYETYFGRGGTNTSKWENEKVFKLKDWAGKKFPSFTFGADLPGANGYGCGASLMAVVEDIAYLYVHGRIEQVQIDKPYREGNNEIAYDTGWYFSVRALAKK